MKGRHHMRVSQGAPGARILAFGGYQPARSVTNDELAQTMDTNDEWIRSRVGIASRRIEKVFPADESSAVAIAPARVNAKSATRYASEIGAMYALTFT